MVRGKKNSKQNEQIIKLEYNFISKSLICSSYSILTYLSLTHCQDLSHSVGLIPISDAMNCFFRAKECVKEGLKQQL